MQCDQEQEKLSLSLRDTELTDLLQSKFGVAALNGRSGQFLPFDLNTPGFHLIRDAKPWGTTSR
jgi:hypothetical protein